MSYITITEEQTNPLAPITSELLKQLRDNPIEMFAGATGAPRLQTDAIDTEVVTAPKLATTDNERDWVAGRVAEVARGAVGSYALVSPDSSFSGGSTVSGSSLSYASSSNPGGGVGTLSGTWRNMGDVVDSDNFTLALRIA